MVGQDATRGEVVDYVRFHEIPLDQLDNVFVVDKNSTLVGAVPVSRLFLVSSDQRIAELYNEPPVSVLPEVEEKDVFELFDKYNLRSLPVTDESGHPIGVITVDDVVSHMRARL